MSTVTTPRLISLAALGFPASIAGNDRDGFVVSADVSAATLQAAVDAAPTDTSDTNASTLRQQATDALAANRTYVALASPSAAQTTAQVKALSRQMNAMIRLRLGQLDGTD